MNPHEDGDATESPSEGEPAARDDLEAWYQRLQILGPARFAPGEVIDPLGRTTTPGYDPLNRPTSIDHSDPTTADGAIPQASI